WHGPYLEWFIYENQMQHMWSGAYESDKPVGTWVKEDAKGKIIEKGKMRHSPASVGYREQDGDWLRWSEQEGKLIPAGRFYLGETLDAYKKRMKSKRNQKPGS
ncbi:MAG TPA: hypothetical protein VFV50_15115, partial [Bdellovibrionales bacterium]|nr:hypothetical protein [Bdellovibrionales bacterium]